MYIGLSRGCGRSSITTQHPTELGLRGSRGTSSPAMTQYVDELQVRCQCDQAVRIQGQLKAGVSSLVKRELDSGEDRMSLLEL